LLVLRDITTQSRGIKSAKTNKDLLHQIEEINRMQKLLEDQATHDSLTGLLNRRIMDEILTINWLRQAVNRVNSRSLPLIIDHFKQIMTLLAPNG
jgi:GGDEF domain-containing protein